MRKRPRNNPFSLFSFQDIITGLCGIMIFMVLVQVVGLVLDRELGDLELKSSINVDDNRETIKKEIIELEKRLNEVKRKSAKAVVAIKDKAKPGEVDKLTKELTEKELIVAALVSQVHDLETQVEAAKKADAEDKAKVREMERTRRLLEQQIAGMKGRRGITLIPERGEFKLPVYMVCSWAGIEIYRPFEKKPKVKVPPEEIETRLAQFLDELDHTTHSAVLLVRPTGVKCMDKAVKMLTDRSFTFGRDPLEENLEIAFDAKGAK